MKSLDDLTHLIGFFENQLNEDSNAMSQEAVDELKYVLEMYARFEDNPDIAAMLRKMEAIDVENQKLKGELESTRAELKEKEARSETFRKTVVQNETEMEKVNSETEERITQLTDEVYVLKNDKNVLLAELEEERAKLKTAQGLLKESEEKCRQLAESLAEVTAKYEKINNLNAEDDKIGRERLELKENECELLKNKLNKLTKEGSKLKVQMEMYKQNHKNDERIRKNLEKEYRTLRETHHSAKETFETGKKKDEELIDRLIAEIRKTDYSQEKLAELLETFGKAHLLENNGELYKEASAVKIEGGNQFESLQDYENMFNDSVAVGQGLDQSKANISLPLEDNEDMPMLESKRNIHFTEAMQKQGLGELINSEVGDEMTVKKETEPKRFMSMKEDVQKQLEQMIGNKTLFKTQKPERLEYNETSEVIDRKDETIKDLKGTRTPVNLDSKLKVEELEKFIEFLHDYLCSEKNPTAFTLTNYERKQIVNRFIRSEASDLRKFMTAVAKVFISHINFLEGHIKGLMNSNSHLTLKVDRLKTEMEVMLNTYLEKNKKNQEFLNSHTDYKISKVHKSNPQESVVIAGGKTGDKLKQSKERAKDVSPKKTSAKHKQPDKSDSGNKNKDGKQRKKKKKATGSEGSDDENIWSKFTSMLPFRDKE